MSALFSQSTPLGGDSIEATVLSVDVQRFVCTVKTTKGQRFNNVIWMGPSGGSGRASSTFTPKMGDRVKLSTGMGYPVIEGFLPRIDRNPTTPISISGSGAIGDTGSLSNIQGGSFNSSKADDMVAGDTVISSEGGGFLAVLRGGTVMLKASSLAQIIVTKLDDCVKVVGRSLELISELGNELHVSVKGRIYKYVAFARTPAEANSGLFRYQEFYGDTAAAEQLKENYELGSAGMSPATGGALRKILVVDAAGIPLRVEEIDLLGNVTTTTKTADGMSSNAATHTSGLLNLKIGRAHV